MGTKRFKLQLQVRKLTYILAQICTMKKLAALLIVAFCFLESSAQKIDFRNSTILVNGKKSKIENYSVSHFKKDFGAPDEEDVNFGNYMYYEKLGMEVRFRDRDEKYIKILRTDFLPLDKTVKPFPGEFTIYGIRITRETTPEDVKKIKELKLKSVPDKYAVLVQEYVYETEDFEFKFSFTPDKKALEYLEIFFY